METLVNPKCWHWKAVLSESGYPGGCSWCRWLFLEWTARCQSFCSSSALEHKGSAYRLNCLHLTMNGGESNMIASISGTVTTIWHFWGLWIRKSRVWIAQQLPRKRGDVAIRKENIEEYFKFGRLTTNQCLAKSSVHLCRYLSDKGFCWCNVN